MIAQYSGISIAHDTEQSSDWTGAPTMRPRVAPRTNTALRREESVPSTTVALWHPADADELIDAVRLYRALAQLDVVREEQPEQALAALETLGRTCARIVYRYARHTSDRPVSLTDLIRAMNPETSLTVARWAGVDPDTPADLGGLDQDLAELRRVTFLVKEQLVHVASLVAG